MRPPIPIDRSRDRRRSPRVACSGVARIISLPSDGPFLPGRVRDLSLYGCGIETVSPLAGGTRAEIVLHVNASSLRAVGQVRAVRRLGVIGVEFLRLSASGQDMLAELIRELTRQQAIASTLRAARREPDPEVLNHNPAALLNWNPAPAGSLVSLEMAETNSPSADRLPTIIEATLDLFA